MIKSLKAVVPEAAALAVAVFTMETAAISAPEKGSAAAAPLPKTAPAAAQLKFEPEFRVVHGQDLSEPVKLAFETYVGIERLRAQFSDGAALKRTNLTSYAEIDPTGAFDKFSAYVRKLRGAEIAGTVSQHSAFTFVDHSLFPLLTPDALSNNSDRVQGYRREVLGSATQRLLIFFRDEKVALEENPAASVKR